MSNLCYIPINVAEKKPSPATLTATENPSKMNTSQTKAVAGSSISRGHLVTSMDPTEGKNPSLLPANSGNPGWPSNIKNPVLQSKNPIPAHATASGKSKTNWCGLLLQAPFL